MNKKQQRLYRYLKKRTKEGKKFFQSKYIKEELNLSAKEIGLNIVEAKNKMDDLKIEKWSNSKGTTWKIELIGSNIETEKSKIKI